MFSRIVSHLLAMGAVTAAVSVGFALWRVNRAQRSMAAGAPDSVIWQTIWQVLGLMVLATMALVLSALMSLSTVLDIAANDAILGQVLAVFYGAVFVLPPLLTLLLTWHLLGWRRTLRDGALADVMVTRETKTADGERSPLRP